MQDGWQMRVVEVETVRERAVDESSRRRRNPIRHTDRGGRRSSSPRTDHVAGDGRRFLTQRGQAVADQVDDARR